MSRLPKKDSKGEAYEDEPEEEAPQAKGSDLRPFIIVQQIRELSRHASHTPREGRRRVFIVDPADRMHAESQNALLKTLEEPGARTVIILVASRPHLLLPTVRSRCFQVGFGAMAPEILAAGLVARGIAPHEAQARAALAEGRPGRALSLDLPALSARRDRILTALEALATNPKAASDIAAYSEQIAGESETELLLGIDLFQALLRDAARSATGRGAILHADVEPRVDRLGRALGADRATELVALADRLRADFRLNLNTTLLCETLMASVAGARIPAFV